MRYINRGESLEKKHSPTKKLDIKQKKENTLHSLYEVEHFLCDMKKIFKSIKLYSLLK